MPLSTIIHSVLHIVELEEAFESEKIYIHTLISYN